MSLDVDRLAEVMLSGAQALIAKSVAPLKAENDALRLANDSLAERLAALEAKAPPAPFDPSGIEAQLRALGDAIAAIPAPVEPEPMPDVAAIVLEAVSSTEALLRDEIHASIAAIPTPQMPNVDALADAIRAEIAEVVKMIPEPVAMPDLSGLATKAEVEAVRDSIPAAPDFSGLASREDLEALSASIPAPADLSGYALRSEIPAPRDWSSEIAALQSSIEAAQQEVRSIVIPDAPDLSGFATKAEVEAVRDAIPEVPEQHDYAPAIDAVGDRLDAALAQADDRLKAVLEGVQSRVDAAVERVERHPGVFPIAKAWEDRVHYAGEVVVHDGQTWQAAKDTGRAPGGDDWTCLARSGADARGFVVCGTFAEDVDYSANDIVMRDGSSFVALRNNPGECPGDGWQLWAGRGKTGKMGPSIKGDPGRDAAEIVALYRDGDDIVLTMAGGAEFRA